MGINKKYDGYKAYDYLVEGKDYRYFELCDPLERVSEWLLELTPEQEARVVALAQSSVIVSVHDHPTFMPQNPDDFREYNREGSDRCNYEGLAASYLDCIFDNMMDGTCTISSPAGWKWNDVLQDLGLRLCDISHQDYVITAGKVRDIYAAHETGRLAFVPVIESASIIENEVDRIEILYGFGVRSMGITYSESNALGSGLKEPGDGGLTLLGHRVVERMNKVGMTIDCSHVGDKTTLDVIKASEKPILLSHGGARALWPTPRMMPDEVLVACAQSGGVIGVEAAPHTTLTYNKLTHDLEAFMEHFEYIVGLVGIDHVAFGPDTMYGDHVAVHDVFAANFSQSAARHVTPEYTRVEYVKGVENPTEASKNILRWLVAHDYSDEDIAKVVGGNVIRVLEQTWA
jgi:membrane dipeptidase